MHIFRWKISFTKGGQPSTFPVPEREESDIINFLSGGDPSGFLAFREVDNSKKRSLEFGYFDIEKEDWVSVHSQDFDFVDGDYEIACCTYLDKIRLVLIINGNRIGIVDVLHGNPKMIEDVFWGSVNTSNRANVSKYKIQTLDDGEYIINKKE